MLDSQGVEYFCMFCDEIYSDPPVEDRVMCIKCKSWTHENCTDKQSISKGYTCDYGR